MPGDVLHYLERFNRKERFFLVGWALGNPTFRLPADFRQSISQVIQLAVPEQAFAAMDYHLDWIYASAYLATHGGDGRVHENVGGLISGNQEDIDFLVAFEDAGLQHVIMIEAKGFTGWTNGQMDSKARRLGQIFGEEGTRWPGIRPRFVLASPRESLRLACDTWAAWMTREDGRPYWMEMELPGEQRRVSRCDERGRANAQGNSWRMVPAAVRGNQRPKTSDQRPC